MSSAIMFREVGTLVHLIESSKLATRVGRPLDHAVKGTPTPRETTMPRRTSRARLLARQSPPRHENSWRFCVDLGYVGESAVSTGRIELSLCTALSATSHGLRMTLGMTLIYPVQRRVVTRRTRLIRCAWLMFCDDAGSFRDTGISLFRYFAGCEKNPRNAKKKRKSGIFPRHTKNKCPVNNDLRGTSACCVLSWYPFSAARPRDFKSITTPRRTLFTYIGGAPRRTLYAYI